MQTAMAKVAEKMNDEILDVYHALEVAIKRGNDFEAKFKEQEEINKQYHQDYEDYKEDMGKVVADLRNENEALRASGGSGKGKAVSKEPEPKKMMGIKSKSASNVRHHKFSKILALVKSGMAVYMNGEAGVGKNVIAEQVAEAMGLPFYMSSKLNDEYGIRGFVDANGRFVSTPFYEAFSGGGVFLLDEMDASNSQALVALNTALSSEYYDFPGVGVVQKHKDFHVLANGNTNGNGATEDYNGREPLDKSTLDRFAFVEIEYDRQIELACAGGDEALVDFVHDVRSACCKMGNQVVLISYRGISNFVKVIALDGFTAEEAMEIALLKGIDRDNRELLHNNLSRKLNKYAKVLNECIWGLNKAA